VRASCTEGSGEEHGVGSIPRCLFVCYASLLQLQSSQIYFLHYTLHTLFECSSFLCQGPRPRDRDVSEFVHQESRVTHHFRSYKYLGSIRINLGRSDPRDRFRLLTRPAVGLSQTKSQFYF